LCILIESKGCLRPGKNMVMLQLKHVPNLVLKISQKPATMVKPCLDVRKICLFNAL
jgi:hypothetical protein